MKAKALGGPARALPPGKSQASAQLAKLSAKQVIAEIARRQDVAIGNAYAMGVCLKELSRAERYRDELGFKSFEELLAAHEHLPTRMTAHKYFTVIDTFSEAEVRRIGGMEKCYQLIRSVKRTDPKADPRKLLAEGARVLGLDVREVSSRRISEALRGRARPAVKRSTAEARSSARRLRGAFRRVRVIAQLRVHLHDGLPCVATHLAPKSAAELVTVLKRAGPT